MKSLLCCLLTIPVLECICAAAMFLYQGGFGGGHGKYDIYIFWLGVPGIWLVDALPDRLAMLVPDFCLILLLPALLNFALIASICICVIAISKRK